MNFRFAHYNYNVFDLEKSMAFYKQALLHQKELRDKGYLTIQWVPGGFDEPRQLMGEEELCIACYEEPELIADMLETIGNTCVKVMERVAEIVPIDCLSIHDMA